MSRHYLFMCGTPRSGTSFMASIVGSHPGIVLGVERYGKRYADRSLQPSHFERDRFFDVREDDTRQTEETVFSRKRDAMARKVDGCAFVGDKYPNLTRHLPWLRERFEDPAVIFVLRNPVDVARSWEARAARQRDRWPASNGFETAVAAWARSIRDASANRRRGSRIVVLDYDLAVSGTHHAGDHLDDVLARIGAPASDLVRGQLARRADLTRRPPPSAAERAAVERLVDERTWRWFDDLLRTDGLPRPDWTGKLAS